jgi:hypothetical protein
MYHTITQYFTQQGKDKMAQVRYQMVLSRELRDKIRMYAKKKGVSSAEVVKDAVKEFFLRVESDIK